VAVNFDRKRVGQEGFGHHSPVGAYDAASDRVLVLDVARYKYPPAWHRLDRLFYAMEDESAPGPMRPWLTPRGFLIVGPPPSSPRVDEANRGPSQPVAVV